MGNLLKRIVIGGAMMLGALGCGGEISAMRPISVDQIQKRAHFFEGKSVEYALTDYNGDGIMDLMYVINAYWHPPGQEKRRGIEIGVFEGNKDGTFKTPKVLKKVISGPSQ